MISESNEELFDFGALEKFCQHAAVCNIRCLPTFVLVELHVKLKRLECMVGLVFQRDF